MKFEAFRKEMEHHRIATDKLEESTTRHWETCFDDKGVPQARIRVRINVYPNCEPMISLVLAERRVEGDGPNDVWWNDKQFYNDLSALQLRALATARAAVDQWIAGELESLPTRMM